MEEKTKGMQYLKQCWSALQSNKTLGLDFNLSAPSGKGNVPALHLHDEFSRYVLTLIDNSGNERKIIKVNIRAFEIAHLVREYDHVDLAKFFHEMQAPKDEAEQEATKPSPAYTVRIRAGAMKGKTPAEILMEDATKEGELVRHRDWLAGFLGQYPKNQEVIDAIDDAIYLLSEGQLTAKQAKAATSGKVMDVWEASFKTMSSGNPATRTSAQVKLTCEFGARNPWCFTLQNSEHPFSNGVVDKKTTLNSKSGTFYLNDELMANLIKTIDTRKFQFETHVFGNAINYVQENEYRPNAQNK